MEWVFILFLVLAIPILFWVILIWLGVFSGLYQAVLEALRQRVRILETVVRVARTAGIIAGPVAIYAVLVWFFFGTFGWGAAVAMALVLPIVFLTSVLVRTAVASGLYEVARYTLRRRVTTPRRRKVRVAEDLVLQRIT